VGVQRREVAGLEVHLAEGDDAALTFHGQDHGAAHHRRGSGA
jgi:hypothetical protein